ncbi:hypothetical protein LJC59_04095 [Desulfovibrio sp. OttesenSCG-928-A18]|nr:hypothetical protein [Desulfovibrio sp. OttesenSCG-928-A18]
MRTSKAICIVAALLLVASAVGYHTLSGQKEKAVRAFLADIPGSLTVGEIDAALFSNDVVLRSVSGTIELLPELHVALSADSLSFKGLNTRAAEAEGAAPLFQELEARNLSFDLDEEGELLLGYSRISYADVRIRGFSAQPSALAAARKNGMRSEDFLAFLLSLHWERCEGKDLEMYFDRELPDAKARVAAFSFEAGSMISSGRFDLRDTVLETPVKKKKTLRFSISRFQGEAILSARGLWDVLQLTEHSSGILSDDELLSLLATGVTLKDWRMQGLGLALNDKELLRAEDLSLNLDLGAGKLDVSADTRGFGLFAHSLCYLFYDSESLQKQLENTLLRLDGKFVFRTEMEDGQTRVFHEEEVHGPELGDMRILLRLSGKRSDSPDDIIQFDSMTLVLDELRFSITDKGLLDLFFTLQALDQNRYGPPDALPKKKDDLRRAFVRDMHGSSIGPGTAMATAMEHWLRFLEYSGGFNFTLAPSESIPLDELFSDRRFFDRLPAQSGYTPPGP